MVQEVGFAMLQERGIDLIAADSPGNFLDDTPTAKLVRQVLGAIAEFDKAMTVAKLRGARERKRKAAGKWRAARATPSVRPRPSPSPRSSTAIPATAGAGPSADIGGVGEKGFLASSGKPYGAAAVARMLG